MKNLFLLFAFLLIAGFCAVETSAQFDLKIPKIKKPKVEQPKTDEPKTDNSTVSDDTKQNENRSSQNNQSGYLTEPEANDVPVFLLETLEIKAKNETRYWKTPNKDNVANWYPQVQFDLFYKFGGKTTRFTAEWFNPDGSLWFSEGLERYGDGLRSPYESKQVYENSIITTGNYGLKITDTKTGKVHFQGKFKVNKLAIKEDPKTLFYVDNEWMLPVGYVGFEKGRTDYEVRTQPMAFFWFKGNLDSSKFEAELHYNNQKINTTDKGGYVNRHAERGETCYQARETCAYGLYAFAWKDFLIDNAPAARQNNPNGYFTKDKPGEYAIKVYYNGEPMRETKFTIDAKGWVARNVFSEQIFLNDHRVVVPVKIIGNMEKWNPATWKTDAFYGNPLNGFVAP